MAMAKYDLAPRIAPNLDLHLVFPLLEFTQERELYLNDQILKVKIELLNNSNMVEYVMDISQFSIPHGECSSSVVEHEDLKAYGKTRGYWACSNHKYHNKS
ncbi:putative eukaryotic translation initiation factor 3 subunit E [Helianthus anomalus]